MSQPVDSRGADVMGTARMSRTKRAMTVATAFLALGSLTAPVAQAAEAPVGPVVFDAPQVLNPGLQQGYVESPQIVDVNGDGHPDVVTADLDATSDTRNLITVRLGAGDGTFGPRVLTPVPTAIAVRIFDVTGDAVPDAVVQRASPVNSNLHAVEVLPGVGDGSFAEIPSQLFNVAGQLIGPATGDFDGNGKTDLVAVSTFGTSDTSVVTFYNTGSALVQGPLTLLGSNTSGGRGIYGSADLTHDGLVDLLVYGPNSQGTVFAGTSSGSFVPVPNPTIPGIGSFWTRPALADFTGDGLVDIATATVGTNGGDYTGGFRLYPNQGGGSFNTNTHTIVGPRPVIDAAYVPADVDADGDQDIVGWTVGLLDVFTNDGTGRFVWAQQLEYPRLVDLALADADGDGLPEALLGQGGSNFPRAAFLANIAHQNSDLTAPELTVPAGVAAEASGPLGAVVTYATPTATDLVDGSVAPVCSHNNGDQFGLGDTLVTCTATDAAGNVTTKSFTVRVQDTAGPTVTAPAPVTVEATGPLGAVANYAQATALDVVDGPLAATCQPRSGAMFTIGTNTVTCVAQDTAGNSGSATSTVTVIDTTAPDLALPANVSANATSPFGALVIYSPPTASDLVDGPRGVICSRSSGSTFPLGTTSVPCSASDSRGNTVTGTFTVRVVDADAPVVTVPAPILLEATGPSGASATWPSPVADDAVDGPRPVTCSRTSGATFSVGITTVTCTSTDVTGNFGVNSFTVTVQDTTGPTLTTVPNRVATATSTAGASVSYPLPTAVDLVDGVRPVTCTQASGTTFAVGVTTVTCTSSDTRGNQASVTLTVTVAYDWSGFQAPVAEGAAYKLGRTIPVKFTLTGASANTTDVVARLWLARVSNATEGDLIEVPATATTPTPGNAFRYDGTRYVFNLDTGLLDAGTWRLRADLGDGVTRTATIILK